MSFFDRRSRLITGLFLFLSFLFIFQILVCYIFVYKTSLKTIENRLAGLTLRIEKDLEYKNGKWDTARYNADPYTPYPNGSSGFTNPLYIVTGDGFLIERSQPIKGFLDTSDFKHLSQFTKPQTINATTNESWRILSRVIGNPERPLGLIAVSFYDPNRHIDDEVDSKLSDTIESIYKSIYIKDNAIHTEKLDIRNIHYEYSFEIVDRYNNVLVNNGRIPSFIDPSYFSQEIAKPSVRIVQDSKSHEPNLIVSRVIYASSVPVGIIVAGESIESIYVTLRHYLFFAVGISVTIIIPLIIYTFFIFIRGMKKENEDIKAGKREKAVKKIVFDKKKSQINIDGNPFAIPYASHQYYICAALFSQPGREWEYDELLDKLGDNTGINTRKVYDAVIAVNKKAGMKLIEYGNKHYFINPKLLKAINRG